MSFDRKTVIFLSLLFLIFFSKSSFIYSQNINKKIDSLKILSKTIKNPEEHLAMENHISSLYNETNPDSALYYSNIVISKTNSNITKALLADIYYQRGVAFRNKGFADSAQFFLFGSIDFYKINKNTEKIIRAFIAIGETYRSAFFLYKAPEFIGKAIKLSKEKKIQTYLPYAYNRMGAAIFEHAFLHSKNNNNIDNTFLYATIRFIDTSFYWSEKTHSNEYHLSNYNILGACYENLGDYNLAIQYFEKALRTADSTGEIIEKPIIYKNISSNYSQTKNFEKAIFYGLKGYHLADSLGIHNNEKYTALGLFYTYYQIGDFRNALKYKLISDSIQTILYDEKYISKTKELETKYESEKKQLEIEKLAQENKLHFLEMKKQKNLIWFVITGLILVIIISIILFRLLVQKRKNNEIISNKNQILQLAYSEINDQNEKIKSQNEEIRIANEQLINFNTALEEKVDQRTFEIKEKNEEIEAQNETYKQINEELHIAKEKSEENDRLKTAFIANMSHEIRTPLNGIIGFSGLLTSQDISQEEQKQFIEIISNSGIQLITLIDDLIDISKIEVNQLKLTFNPVHLNNLLSEIYLTHLSKATGSKLEYTVHKGLDDIDSIIITDEARLRQILLNLLGNAFKFIESGYIKFGYTIVNDFIEFFVSDSGIGIASEKQELIFDRFRQAEVTTSKIYGGTGLGLSISKSLVQLLGGSIRLESELNRGSTFYFTIPFMRSQKEIKIKKTQLSENIIETHNTKTILVAEDEEFNFLLIETVLLKMKFNVLHANNGKKAIEMVSENPNINLVLMDIKMPVLNGYEAITEIKKIRPDLPIIAQSAYAQSGDMEKTIELGCVDYMTKPLNLNLLKELIVKYS